MEDLLNGETITWSQHTTGGRGRQGAFGIRIGAVDAVARRASGTLRGDGKRFLIVTTAGDTADAPLTVVVGGTGEVT
jgi:hypothetical protein